MASVTNRGNPMTNSMSSGCAPVCCPDCGGLECLCRPRFFSGQLLTEDDLNLLDHYITSKNKLHNRYLIGWGVVCGMNVVCDACDGMITVKSGYALSPCGDDIVVCADTAVDVCSMIQKCTKKQPRDCQPAQPGGPDPCAATTEKWILSIHYDEKSSRGIVPLKNVGASSCGCGGHASSSGCGCGGSTKSSASKSCSCGCGATSQPAPGTTGSVQCQPTVVCEGYTFQVCKVQPTLEQKPPLGALVQRFTDCLTALKGLVSAPPVGNDPQQIQNWCCAIRDNLLNFFADNPGYACSIPSQLAVMCQSGADVQTIKQEVAYLLAQYIKDCFCAAFLPPCACAVEDASVPLATITVSKKDGSCRVVSICNLDVRKFAVTLPNLSYWLSPLPFAQNLRKLLSSICCKPLVKRQVAFGEQANQFRARFVDEPAGNDPLQQTRDFSEVIAGVFLQPNQTIDAQTLAYSILGLADEKGQPFLSPLEMSHPLETVIASQIGLPFAQAVIPSGLGRTVSSPGEPPVGQSPTTAKTQRNDAAEPEAASSGDLKIELAAMRAQMDAMKKDLAHSQEQIDKLNKRRNR